MAKPVNKTLVGLFVVGAVVLIVAAIALFGSGKFLAKRPKFVMFFSGSVHGLTVGSPVEFQGVKIGEVSAISARFDPKNLTVVIPVYVEFDPESLSVPGELKGIQKTGNYAYIKGMIAKGLKAQLKVKSLLTGQLYIAGDFYPDKPIRLVGLETRYPEIPTIPSTADVLMATLDKLPISEIADKLVKVTEGIEKIVNSPDVTESIKNLNLALKDINGLVRQIDAEIKPTAADIKDTLSIARGAFSQAEKTLAINEGIPGKVADNLQNTLKNVDATLERLRWGIASYEKIADRNINLGYDVSKTLQEIETTARSIRSLTDYLERHPEALVKGKLIPKGE
jgi:paraquat-inducible protein B